MLQIESSENKLPVYLSVCFSICPMPVCLPAFKCLSVFFCLSICLIVCLFVSLSVCFSACLLIFIIIKFVTVGMYRCVGVHVSEPF